MSRFEKKEMAAEIRTVSCDEQVAALAAIHGLEQGELSALAKYLEKGFPLSPEIRQCIVDAIQGSLFRTYSLRLVKSRRGVGNPFQTKLQICQEEAVAHFFEYQQSVSRNRKTAVANTMEQFDLSRSAVEKAIAGCGLHVTRRRRSSAK